MCKFLPCDSVFVTIEDIHVCFHRPISSLASLASLFYAKFRIDEFHYSLLPGTLSYWLSHVGRNPRPSDTHISNFSAIAAYNERSSLDLSTCIADHNSMAVTPSCTANLFWVISHANREARNVLIVYFYQRLVRLPSVAWCHFPFLRNVIKGNKRLNKNSVAIRSAWWRLVYGQLWQIRWWIQ